MGKFKKKLRRRENFKALEEYLPNDHSHCQSLASFIEQACDLFPESPNVLDLGCGEGDSIELFKKMIPTAEWHGVDIEDSPEVRRRTREHNAIKNFDGVNLPYTSNYFDVIYCNQVFEHVRHPDKLAVEALRVLRPGGLFAGSVSYLEPFHSFSIFNFTPFGIISVFSDAGFEVKEIRPGIDASYLINRLLLNRAKMTRFVWNRNYLHGIADIVGSIFRLGHRERNFLKVQFAGHLVFLAKRPESSEHDDG